MAMSLKRIFGVSSKLLFVVFCMLAVASTSSAFGRNHYRNSLNAVEPEAPIAVVPNEPTSQTQPSIDSPTLQPLEAPVSTSGNPSFIASTPQAMPIAVPLAAPTPTIVPVPQSQPIPLPPFLPIPAAYYTCIGESPGPMFTCDQGIWATNSSLRVGPAGDLLSLVLSGPTYIGGDLTILTGGNWTFIPPLENEEWDSMSTKAMLTVKNCITTAFSPRLATSVNTTRAMWEGRKSSTSVYTKTIGGIDSACDLDSTAKYWNVQNGDGQQVYTAGARKCEITIGQYREFPSETDPTRFMMRLRLQWRNNGKCGVSPLAIIFPTMAGIFIVVFASIFCCSCNGGGGGGGGSSDYGTFDSGGGGGGGGGGGDSGGGGGFASSSGGSWD